MLGAPESNGWARSVDTRGAGQVPPPANCRGGARFVLLLILCIVRQPARPGPHGPGRPPSWLSWLLDGLLAAGCRLLYGVIISESAAAGGTGGPGTGYG